MKLVLRDGGAVVSDRLRTHLDRRLAFALSGHGERVMNVLVRFSMDTTMKSPLPRCDIELKLRPRRLRVADTGNDLFIAVENAAARLTSSLARALEREHFWPEAHPPAPLPAPPPVRIARKARRA